ncbi:MAG TPA: Ig-like domain-containing protein [Blastocatellia bacterium]|nr:Ig-like domain-containing protein [Blastocatellia bacterium]
MFSRKVLLTVLIGAALIGGFALKAFTFAGPVFTGGPKGDGNAQLFLSLDPSANPTALSSFSIKPNKTFQTRLYFDTTNLILNNSTNGITNQPATLGAFTINVTFDTNFVQLVNPQIAQDQNFALICSDPGVNNPDFTGVPSPYNICNDYTFGPSNITQANSQKRISFVYLPNANVRNNNTTAFKNGLIPLPTLVFKTIQNGTTTIKVDGTSQDNANVGSADSFTAGNDINNQQPSSIPFTATDVALNISNAPPSITSSASAKEGDTAHGVNIVVNDADGDPVTITSVTQPTLSGATLSCPGVGTSQAVPITCTLNFPTLGFTSAGNFTAAISATDGTDTTNQTINITVGNVNRPPSLAAITNRNLAQGATLDIPLSATDPDPEDTNITFSVTNVVPPLSNVTITPSGSNTAGNLHIVAAANAAPAVYTVTVTANDNDAVTPQANGSGPLTSSQQFTLTIFKPNSPPVFTAPAPATVTVNENATTSFTVTASDPDATDALSFTVTRQDGTAAPAFVTLVNTTGTNPSSTTVNIDLTNNFNAAGTYPLRVRVTDNNTSNDPNGPKFADTNFTLTVNNVNRPPTLAPLSPVSVTELSTLDVSLTANDPDGNSTLTFSVQKLTGPGSNFATITNATTNGTATLHLAPQIGDNGVSTFRVTVNDNDPQNPLTATQDITVTVNYNDRPPVLTLPNNVPVTMNENDAQVTVTVSATDPDLSRTPPAPNLTFSIQVTALNTELSVPNTSFITLGAATQVGTTFSAPITINPLALNGRAAGNYTVSVTVNDNDSTGPNGSGPKTDNKQFQVTIVNVPPTTPVITNPPTTINEGQTADVNISSTDIGGNNLLALSASTSCIPAPLAPGGSSTTTSPSTTSRSSGRVTGSRVSATQPSRAGVNANSFVSVTDNGNGTGVLHIAPGFLDAGQCTVTVTATEANVGNNVPGVHSASNSFNLTVVDVNRPVVFTTAPNNGDTFTVKETNTQDISLVANDPDTNNVATFTLTNAPSFVTITNVVSANGVSTANIHIAPQILDAKNSPFNNIVVTVNDQHGSTDSRTFNLIVTPANRPPVLTLSQSTINVTVGTSGTITASATDPDSGAPLNQTVTLSLAGNNPATVPSFVTIGQTTKDAQGNFKATINIAPPIGTTIGPITVNVVATDNGTPNLTDTKTLTINVQDTPQVILIAPNGGETLTGGQTFQISWTASAATGVNRLRQTLSLSLDGGTTFPIVITNAIAGGTQSFNWTVPNISTTTARVKVTITEPACTGAVVATQCNGVTLPADRTTSDTSDANFTIKLSGQTAPAIAIVSPTNNDTLVAGPTAFDANGNPVGTQAPFPIVFTTSGIPANTSFTIDFSINGGTTFTTIGTAQASPFNWTIPTTLPDGTPLSTNNGVLRITGGGATATSTGLKIGSQPVVTRATYLKAGGNEPTNQLQVTGLGFVQDEMDIVVCNPVSNVCTVEPTLTRAIPDPTNGQAFLLIFQDVNNTIPVGTPINIQVRNHLTGAISKPLSFTRTNR